MRNFITFLQDAKQMKVSWQVKSEGKPTQPRKCREGTLSCWPNEVADCPGGMLRKTQAQRRHFSVVLCIHVVCRNEKGGYQRVID